MYFDAEEGTFVDEDGDEVRVDVEGEEEEELEEDDDNDDREEQTPAAFDAAGAHTITSRF